MIGDVESQNIAAIADPGSGCGKLSFIASVDDHGCARRPQALRQGKANALRRPRHQRAATRQIEKTKRHGILHFYLDNIC